MSKTIKLLSILLTLVVISGMMLMPTYANNTPADTVTLKPSDITAQSTDASDDIKTLGGKVYGAIFTAGIVLSVIIMAVLGIRYMMGSTEDKSEYKKSMMPYAIGALCIFGASTIASIVYNLTSQI